MLNRGETLVLVSEVSGSHFQKCKTPSSGQNNKFLRCFDVNGESVYLGLEQSGKFSPVAGQENISGVHTIKNLLNKRMPITVKMVHGSVPGGVLKNCPNQSSPEMRLLGVVHEDCVMAMPLLKDLSGIVAIPLCAGLKLQAPRNNDELRKMSEYSRLAERCRVLGRDSADKIHVLDMSSKSKDFLHIKNSHTRHGGRGGSHQYFGNIHSQIKKLNDGGKAANKRRGSSKSNHGTTKTMTSCSSPAPPPKENDEEPSKYDEIDIIYDYVRGFGPLPKSIARDFDKMDDPVKKVKSKQARPVQTSPKSSKSPKMVPSESAQTEQRPSEPSAAPREPSPDKSASLPTKKPQVESQKPVEVVKEEDSPPEPPPIETIPVRRSVSMPNATATNIVVSGVSTPDQVTSPVAKIQPKPAHVDSTPANQMNMTDNVAYSNFVPHNNKDNVYDKITHEHEGFTVDLKSPSMAATPRGRTKKGTVASSNKKATNNKLFVKSQSPSKSNRPRLFKHSFSSPAVHEKSPTVALGSRRTKSPKIARKKGNVSRKNNPTPSPIFNMRYKSLTDLAIDFDTLDSSNSGGRVSEGSAELVYSLRDNKGIRQQQQQQHQQQQQLPRPKSLTNLVSWPANQVDCIVNNNNNIFNNNINKHNTKQYNNIMSNLFHNNNNMGKKHGTTGVGGQATRKLSDGLLIYGQQQRKSSNAHAHKRLSALYL